MHPNGPVLTHDKEKKIIAEIIYHLWASIRGPLYIIDGLQSTRHLYLSKT